MNCWIAVSTPENAEIVKKALIWGVTDSYKNALNKVQIGDGLALYVKGGLFTGAYEIISDLFIEDKEIFVPKHDRGDVVKGFRNRVKLKPVVSNPNGFHIKLIMDKLSFIDNRRYWGGYFFRAMIPISKADFEEIRNTLARRD